MAPKDSLLHPLQGDEVFQQKSRVSSSYNPRYSYRLPYGETKQYEQQFADMYFARLTQLKKPVVAVAKEEWEDFEIAGEEAQRVDRVLDVRQGQLCWVVGTIFMDMPLKPNILEDISKEHWIAGPPPRQSYFSTDSETQVMLEDESGRLRLSGQMLQSTLLVTGIIVGVLGTENANGDFDVLDIKVPDLPEQPERWARDKEGEDDEDKMEVEREKADSKKIAFISGLDISGTSADTLNLSMLSEYVLGEALASDDQHKTTGISRLIIAGNSISDIVASQSNDVLDDSKKTIGRKYGYDANSYNPTPTQHLDHFLAELLPSIPITIMSGEHDPANSSLPQQGIHSAMFSHSRNYATANVADPVEEGPGWFDSVTNPWDGDVEGWRLLGNSGQPVDDILKYIELGGTDGKGAEGRLEVMESLLRWRNCAPTAPDTLWCYPFQEKDQFVIEECPHVFFVGNQPRFDTTIIEGPTGQRVRLIAIPKFHQTGELILLDSETLEVEVVKFDIADGEEKNGNVTTHL
jgi:DNA polymerase delta subunit 2